MLRRWLATLFGVVAVLLVPWAIYLKLDLSAHHVVRHWDTVWTGYDIALAGVLLAPEKLSAAGIGPSEEHFLSAVERVNPGLAKAA